MQVTKEIVKEVMQNLIEKNSQTTSLEVKEELRNLGYWVTQREVSNTLNELSNEDDSNLEVTFSICGKYKIYSIIKNTSITIPTIIKNIKLVDIQETNPKDWYATCTTNSYGLYFKGNLTRDEVRCAYVKEMKKNNIPVKFHDTRAIRIK